MNAPGFAGRHHGGASGYAPLGQQGRSSWQQMGERGALCGGGRDRLVFGQPGEVDPRAPGRCLLGGRVGVPGGRTRGAGAFVFAPRGLEHAYWNAGETPAKMPITISPPGFEGYFGELAAMGVRKALSEKYDIEVVGPPRQATD
jgi:hypothetical protein